MNHLYPEIIKDRNKPLRLHFKPWDETFCSVALLNTNKDMAIHPYKAQNGFEYNVILSKKPLSNVIALSIETDGLDFFYQPPLTLQEIKEGCYRPPHIVGSYAVYHKTAWGDYSAFRGGKNYKNGKAFHIHRPKVIDSAGNWVWGNLNIDVEKGLLTNTIPWKFLETAVYPIYHAAGLNFGKESAATASSANAVGVLHYAKAASTPASNGTLTSVKAYLKESVTDGGGTFITALYANNGTAPGALHVGITSGGGALENAVSWVESSLSWPIVAGTQYSLGISSVTSGYIYYYDVGGNYYYRTIAAWPNPAGGFDGGARNIGVYGVYTPPSSAMLMMF